MTRPEDAVEQARASAAAMREAGAYPEADSLIGPVAASRPTYSQLLEWAVIDPEVGDVRSTRRWGAPITRLKRALVRLLYQYHAALAAEQTRVNINLIGYVHGLEERVAELERGRAAELAASRQERPTQLEPDREDREP